MRSSYPRSVSSLRSVTAARLYGSAGSDAGAASAGCVAGAEAARWRWRSSSFCMAASTTRWSTITACAAAPEPAPDAAPVDARAAPAVAVASGDSTINNRQTDLGETGDTVGSLMLTPTPRAVRIPGEDTRVYMDLPRA